MQQTWIYSRFDLFIYYYFLRIWKISMQLSLVMRVKLNLARRRSHCFPWACEGRSRNAHYDILKLSSKLFSFAKIIAKMTPVAKINLSISFWRSLLGRSSWRIAFWRKFSSFIVSRLDVLGVVFPPLAQIRTYIQSKAKNSIKVTMKTWNTFIGWGPKMAFAVVMNNMITTELWKNKLKVRNIFDSKRFMMLWMSREGSLKLFTIHGS